MAETDPARTGSSTSSVSARGTGAPPEAFERGKRHLVVACAAIAGGLAIAGSIDRTSGGLLVLIGWFTGIIALHRIGRSGSDSGVDSGAHLHRP
ncbi:MAG TPA: hypothetical protein VM580_13145 [Labilithrix sp.]|nr:hypothetical protein [Labilithrix sp.]